MRPLTAHQSQCDRRLSTPAISTDRDRNSMGVVHSARQKKKEAPSASAASKDPVRRKALPITIGYHFQDSALLINACARLQSHGYSAFPWPRLLHNNVTEGQQWPCSVAQCICPPRRREQLHRLVGLVAMKNPCRRSNKKDLFWGIPAGAIAGLGVLALEDRRCTKYNGIRIILLYN